MGLTNSNSLFRNYRSTERPEGPSQTTEGRGDVCRAWDSPSSGMGHWVQGQSLASARLPQALFHCGCSGGGAACGGCELSLGAGQPGCGGRGRVAVCTPGQSASAPLFSRPACWSPAALGAALGLGGGM